MNDKLYSKKGTHRYAYVHEGEYFCKGKYVVEFLYDGFPDFEWKKGAHGMSCDICDTLKSAKGKVRRYIKLDEML